MSQQNLEYLDQLREAYFARKRQNVGYSERAFARDLGISPGYISLVLSGKRRLSLDKAFAIAQRLNWGEIETNQFLEKLQREKIQGSKGNVGLFLKNDRQLSLDEFNLIADGKHAAILAYLQGHNSASLNQIFKHLGGNRAEIELALKRLLRMRLVSAKKGRYSDCASSHTVKEVSSEAIRRFHREAIANSLVAMDEQPLHCRTFESLITCIDPDKVKNAKIFLRQFLQEFEKKFGNKRDGEVYQMNIQLFSLKNGEKK